MMVLVIGGSGSGKSSYAEETAVSLARESAGKNDMKKYYLASMQVFDEEGRRKVQRHRALRKGKGFLTIEQPTGISRALEKMETGERTALLECVSNLTANEMFSGEAHLTESIFQTRSKAGMQVVEDVLCGIRLLREQTTHLVVVSSNVFEDGITYDAATMEYIQAMGRINRKLAALAERVVEVVAGIPVMIK